MKDREILDLFWMRDESALSETANVYGNYCYAIAYNILNCNEDAEECVNDTWMVNQNVNADGTIEIDETMAGIVLEYAVVQMKIAIENGKSPNPSSID